ncbi:AAA family ATPase [Hymenobacter sp. M29]|uniref:AAA family ATPase n=1 Tax=Hymenobacter mellowenesis TaxID=3063995 RepID=A0ABT9ACW1_9BACT|nr:AAA family ATPase [Hymenobacter sp. M29]MDO7847675.1 AAA family ATPase [Hymenobacter sp. M29]
MPATKILIEGPSGTGKSTSLRNLPSEQTFIISPNDKPLPFQGSAKKYVKGKNLIVTEKVTDIPAALKHISDKLPAVKYAVIEDSTHFQNARMMSDAFTSDKGFAKWGVFGKDIYQALANTQGLRDDLFVVVLSHVQTNDVGESVFKTSGKLLDQTVDIPSYFTYILHTEVVRKDDKVAYSFLTNSDGNKQAKTPMGLYDTLLIPNDLMEVITKIKAYQEGE